MFFKNYTEMTVNSSPSTPLEKTNILYLQNLFHLYNLSQTHYYSTNFITQRTRETLLSKYKLRASILEPNFNIPGLFWDFSQDKSPPPGHLLLSSSVNWNLRV